jgi:tRNA-specific 2-thiouridylase
MSGGVDSAVVAAMLKRRGHDVIGVTMQIWQESQNDPRHAGCCSLGAVEDARRVARMLDVPHYVINFKDAFREAVIEDFVAEYARGRTPNPCVQCNRKVKFEALLNKADELGCGRLATGHYARLRRDRVTGHMRLMRARGEAKDQSYVLYMLRQEQMRRLLFPMGELPDKAETRRLAAELGLPVADKPDSQEICFVSDAGGYVEFLRKERPDLLRPGEVVDTTGRTIGRHAGVATLTVGQRRGLGVSAGRPLYVLRLEPAQNRVVVGDADDLLAREVRLEDVRWHVPEDEIRVHAKIRYNMVPQRARLIPGEPASLVFDEPVRGPAPGQIAVAYAGRTVVAGGIIAASSASNR